MQMILEHSKKMDLALGRMKINARKGWKIFFEETKHCLNSFFNIFHSRNTRMHRHECNMHNHLFNLEKQTIFPILYFL
jgi:hypothetical protein